ncbi:MAG: 3-deoxy-7-phosphoheptulonate synthase [Christensenellales bacterium]|jgi:3-deoxy-7-phosphoheptulonate synthase
MDEDKRGRKAAVSQMKRGETMNLRRIKRIPTAEEIVAQIPFPKHLLEMKQQRDDEIKRVFKGKDKRFILIIGPCSADSEDPVCEYISRLARVQDRVKNEIIIIPRIYTNKPRSTGEGYKGMMHQPDPEKEADLYEGIKAIRRLHIRALGESGLPAADEMLYPENYAYLADVLAYHAVGARSVENQQHRLTASGVDMPVGMKNPTSGDLSVMLNSINAAQMKHRYIYSGWEVKTQGNPYAHAVLRGAVDTGGRSIPNYHYEHLIALANDYTGMGLKNPAIIVDTNHANSMRRFDEQPRIAHEVMASRRYDSKLARIIKGLMIESYIEEGRQEIGDNIYGKSITDPCLGWGDTERLIYDIAESI